MEPARPRQTAAEKPDPDRQRKSRSWDAVADWYAGWSGPEGSRHHKTAAIPALLELLQPKSGERILDIGCGAGPLCPSILQAGASYTGVDLSPKLITVAKRHYGKGAFYVGDATRLAAVAALQANSFDAATFLLSIQDINPLEPTIASAAWALKPHGRLVVLMLHPCFRIPRQSGWGWDEGRKLRYRRIDRYLTPLDIPMKAYGRTRQGSTRTYHRPLQQYVGALSASGFVIDGLREAPAPPAPGSTRETRADRLAREEFPLFLGLRAMLR